jgi:hypothetical protein
MLMTVDSLLLLILYVDDLLITGCSTSSIAAVKRILHDKFLMTDVGPLHFFLGLKISQDVSGIKLSQAKYARVYRQLVGSLLYLTHSRPDLSYAVGAVSRFMQELHKLHWKDAKRILRYVQGTITFGIHYAADSTLDLIGVY